MGEITSAMIHAKVYSMHGDVSYLSVEYDDEFYDLIQRESGKKLEESWGQRSLVTRKGDVKKGTPLGDCPYFVADLLLVSDKLKQLIQSFSKEEIEFLPVEIDGQPGYYYMNVLCIIDALDENRSELRRFDTGRIMYVIQARFRDDIINGHSIFRLPNYHGVYVTAELRQYLQSNGVVGVKFEDTSRRVENPFEEVLSGKGKKR